MSIRVVNAKQTKNAIVAVLGKPGKGNLIVEVFHIHAFGGTWFEIHREKEKRSRLGGFASPMLTERLKRHGIAIGDPVLVARVEGLDDEFSLRVVSPLTEDNKCLIGERFERSPVNEDALDLLTDGYNISVMVASASTELSEDDSTFGKALPPGNVTANYMGYF